MSGRHRAERGPENPLLTALPEVIRLLARVCDSTDRLALALDRHAEALEAQERAR